MQTVSERVMKVRADYNQSEALKNQIDAHIKELGELNDNYAVFVEAQQLLSSVSDSNTKAVLDYITGVINKALSQLFPHDSRSIYLEKSLHRGVNPHIDVKLMSANGKVRDLELQSGTGLRQIISFLFVISLIEIRKGRRLLIMDELLSGLHEEAKDIIIEIVSIFAEGEFQFVMVEYGVEGFGRIYDANKQGTTAELTLREESEKEEKEEWYQDENLKEDVEFKPSLMPSPTPN